MCVDHKSPCLCAPRLLINKPKAIIVHGISGSGKSTFADAYVKETLNTVEINRDMIRNVIFKELRPNEHFSWKKWNFKNEPEVTKRHREEILKASKSKNNIVISDTNLDKKFNNKLENYLNELGFEINHKWIDVPLETCLERDAQRSDPVGEEVIRNQFKKYELLKLAVLPSKLTFLSTIKSCNSLFRKNSPTS